MFATHPRHDRVPTDGSRARHARLLIVRHRESTWNRERRWTGQADPPLTDTGEADARSIGAYLAGLPFDAVVASDLVRARRTAELISEALSPAALTSDARLREIAVPPWTGLTKDEIEARFPGHLQRWRTDRPEPPAGSEPWGAFERRVLDVLREHAHRWDHALVVAHSGVLRVLRTALHSPHGKVGRSKGVWVEARDGELRVGPLQRLRGPSSGAQ